MTKPDVLDGFDKIKVCTHYNYLGKQTGRMPFDIVHNPVEPVYKELPGWKLPSGGAKDIADLPDGLTEYISFIEKELEVPVVIVSVGPDRSETLSRHPEFAWAMVTAGKKRLTLLGLLLPGIFFESLIFSVAQKNTPG